MAYGLRGVVASSAQISVEAGRPGWHAARAGLAACLGMHFENGMPGPGCPCPESRPRERAQPGGRKRSSLGASGGHGWPKRASGDGARATRTHQRTLHPPLHTPASVRWGKAGKEREKCLSFFGMGRREKCLSFFGGRFFGARAWGCTSKTECLVRVARAARAGLENERSPEGESEVLSERAEAMDGRSERPATGHGQPGPTSGRCIRPCIRQRASGGEKCLSFFAF